MKTIGLFDKNGNLIRLRDVVSDYNEEGWYDVPDGLIRPILANGSVVEGATSDELSSWQTQKRQEKYLIIDSEMRRLSFGAIAIILGLKGLTTEELLARKQLYETLYEYCSMPEPPAEIEQIIDIKRQLFNATHGTSLDMASYKQMVIDKFNQAETAFKQFNLMIEATRTKWKSVVDDDGRFNAIYDIIKSVNEDTRPEDVPTLFNQVMSV